MGTAGILTEMPLRAAPSRSDAGRAVAQLEGVSPEIRGCGILDGRGEVLAASGSDPRRWGDPTRELIAAADAAGAEPASHVHVASGDGEVFCVRHRGLTAVAVAERFALSSLVFADLRAALRDLTGA
jgi:hypothetical protein